MYYRNNIIDGRFVDFNIVCIVMFFKSLLSGLHQVISGLSNGLRSGFQPLHGLGIGISLDFTCQEKLGGRSSYLFGCPDKFLFGIVTFDQAVGSLAKVVGGGGHKSGCRYQTFGPLSVLWIDVGGLWNLALMNQFPLGLWGWFDQGRSGCSDGFGCV